MRAQTPEDLKPKSEADFTGGALAFRGAQIAEAFRGRLPSAKELRHLTEELGVEIATHVFLRAVQEAPGHATFAKDVRGFDFDVAGDIRSRASHFELLFIPSQLPQSGRKWGDHVETWRKWARSVGFKTDDVATDPKATVSTNARIILEYIKKNPNPNRVFVSYGQGTSELRLLLQRSWTSTPEGGGRNDISGIKGWISICGSYSGCSSSREMLKSRIKRWSTALDLRIAGRNPLVLRETSSEFSLWKSPLKFPKGFVAVSVVGTPLKPQLPIRMHAMYSELAKVLPNDGVVTVTESVVPGGFILPISGMSHRAEDLKLEQIFKRLLCVLAFKLDQSQDREVPNPDSRDLRINTISF